MDIADAYKTVDKAEPISSETTFGKYTVIYDGPNKTMTWKDVYDVREKDNLYYVFYTTIDKERVRIKAPISRTVIKQIMKEIPHIESSIAG